MTDRQILEKAMNKAVDSGWDIKSYFNRLGYYPDTTPREFSINNIQAIYYLIFNHDFAKALWGDEENKSPLEANIGGKMGGSFDAGGAKMFEVTTKLGWKHHLQMMVIADDPIEYLGDNS